ncbi:hypothetical protein SK128_026340, partial [Halocaridina rubra]
CTHHQDPTRFQTPSKVGLPFCHYFLTKLCCRPTPPLFLDYPREVPQLRIEIFRFSLGPNTMLDIAWGLHSLSYSLLRPCSFEIRTPNGPDDDLVTWTD